MAKYEKFSTVCHLTSCKNARRVIEDNGIDPEIRTFDSPLAKESVKVRSVGFEANTDTNLRELCLFFSTRSRTDGPCSSCEMIILRNKSRGGIIRVCMGIFTTALKKKIQSNSHTPSPSTRSSKTIYWCQVTGGLRRGTVCKGGRVNKLVFNRHVYAGRLNSVGFTGKIEFVVNWNETTVYVLKLCVGFVATRSFWAWSFRFSDRAFENGVCSLGLFLCFLMYVENLEMGNSLKWVLFNIVSGQITSDALWK